MARRTKSDPKVAISLETRMTLRCRQCGETFDDRDKRDAEGRRRAYALGDDIECGADPIDQFLRHHCAGALVSIIKDAVARGRADALARLMAQVMAEVKYTEHTVRRPVSSR